MDRIDLEKIVEEVVGLEKITVSQDIDIVDDHDEEWVDGRSNPDAEFDDEQQQSYEQDLTNLRALGWLNEMTSDPMETSVTIQDHVSACPTYKQGMKAIGFSLEDEDASEVDHEDFMRRVIAKFGARCLFCNLEGHFKSDCPQFWDAVADIKHPRHEEALSGVKASKARLLSEAEARRKEKPQELATKKMQAVTEEIREPEPVTAVDDLKIDYRAAAMDALNRVQQELVTKEIEQKVKLELENAKIQEKLNAFEASEVEETKAPSSLSLNLNVISGQTIGMVPQGSRIQSINSVAGHQVTRNLSEPSEFTMMQLDTYADYLRQVEPRTESRAVRALLTTGGPRKKKLHGRYVEV